MICILPLADLKKTTVPLQSLISPYLTMNGGKFRKVGFLLYSISDLSFSILHFPFEMDLIKPVLQQSSKFIYF